VPPLHPDNAVIDEVKRLVGRRQGPILLRGVRPELAHTFDMVQAVDKNSAMVDRV
jgi:glutaredoxin 2